MKGYGFWFWFYSGYRLFDDWFTTKKHNTNVRLEWRACNLLSFGIEFLTYHTIFVKGFGFELHIHHLRIKAKK